jgi:hypothetical protein
MRRTFSSGPQLDDRTAEPVGPGAFLLHRHELEPREPDGERLRAHTEVVREPANRGIVENIDRLSLVAIAYLSLRHQELRGEYIRFYLLLINPLCRTPITEEHRCRVDKQLRLLAMELVVTNLMGDGKPLPVGVVGAVDSDDRTRFLDDEHSRDMLLQRLLADRNAEAARDILDIDWERVVRRREELPRLLDCSISHWSPALR